MQLASGFRAALVALVTLAGAAVSTAAHADNGQIWLWELKGGWFIGGSAGGGTLLFHGRRYPLSVGGVSAGLVFGGSETRLQGTVSNIRSPSDVAGVYGAAGAGVAIGVGARVIILKNEKGAVLRLSGRQIGLLANADVSGLVIGLQ
ncbi:MAG: hypothetical protein WAU90_15295 [Methyloceanibacter sp.]